jgi:hypothetical protein
MGVVVAVPGQSSARPLASPLSHCQIPTAPLTPWSDGGPTGIRSAAVPAAGATHRCQGAGRPAAVLERCAGVPAGAMGGIVALGFLVRRSTSRPVRIASRSCCSTRVQLSASSVHPSLVWSLTILLRRISPIRGSLPAEHADARRASSWRGHCQMATTARRGLATGSAASAINPGAALMAIAAAGFIAATGFAVLMLALKGVRAGQVWAWVTAVATPRWRWCCPPLPLEPGHPRPPRPHLPGRGRLRGRRGRCPTRACSIPSGRALGRSTGARTRAAPAPPQAPPARPRRTA